MNSTVYIEGIGAIGPGFEDWPTLAAALRGEQALAHEAAKIPTPAILPPAERRRVGKITKLSIACGLQAIEQAGADASQLAAVFATSGGDGENCDVLCDALAQAAREISPTRFHNSVHNAASGYWSIATHCMRASTTVCAYDGSFAAGLLEAFTQVIAQQQACLLVAADTPYGGALGLARPMSDAMGVALLLSPVRTEKSLASLSVSPVEARGIAALPDSFAHMAAELPAARALPLLHALVNGGAEAPIEYIEGLCLLARVQSLQTHPA